MGWMSKLYNIYRANTKCDKQCRQALVSKQHIVEDMD